MTFNLELPEELQRYVEAAAITHHRSPAEEVVAMLRLAQEIAAQREPDPVFEQLRALNARVMQRRNHEPLPDPAEIIFQSRLHDH